MSSRNRSLASLPPPSTSSTDTIYEDFTATVLPAPDSEDPQTYALTLADMYGDNQLPTGVDLALKFSMHVSAFRREIATQVSGMEVKRSLEAWPMGGESDVCQ